MKKLLIASVVASTGLSGMATTALASSDKAFTLEEVTVTARKRDESLQEVPVAVSSFSADDIAGYNMTDTRDIAKYSPGLFIENNAAQGLTSAKTTIRGQVQSDTLATLDPSVGWYLDDIYMARTTGTVGSMFDLSRVEVLKGPQGVLYGRNTTGGAIKLVTTKADASAGVSGFVTAGAGNFGAEKFGGAINVPLIEDVLAVRLSYLSDEITDGYGDITVTPLGAGAISDLYPGSILDFATHKEKVGQKDSELARIGVSFTPNEDLSIDFLYDKSDLDVNALLFNPFDAPAVGYTAPANPRKDTVVNARQEATAETELLSLTVNYDINDSISSKFVWGWRDLESSFISDVDGTALPLNYFIEPFVQNAEQTSLEWTLSGVALDDKLNWMAGIYLFEEEGIDFANSNGASSIPNGIFGGTTNATIDKNESDSIFVSLNYALTDKLNINAGVRRTEDTKPVSVNAEILLAPPIAGVSPTACRFDVTLAPNANLANCTWSASDEYSNTSYTIGLDYALNDDTLIYVKSSSAYRAGGQNIRGVGIVANPAGGTINTFENFDPEEVTDIELGVKGQFFDNSLQLNAALYHMDYEDVQRSLILTGPAGTLTFVDNTSDATFDGLEVEAQWIVTDNFKLSGTLGLLDWDFDDSTDFANSAPKTEYTLRANYLVPLDTASLVFDLNYSYRGEFYPNSSATRQQLDAAIGGEVEDVALVGARATLDLDMGVSVTLWGDNLTDEEYTLSPLVLSVPASLYSAGIGQPRTYGLDVKYSF